MLAVVLNSQAEAGLSGGRRAIPASEHWKAETPASPPSHHHFLITIDSIDALAVF
jgi:hypothetical protein